MYDYMVINTTMVTFAIKHISVLITTFTSITNVTIEILLSMVCTEYHGYQYCFVAMVIWLGESVSSILLYTHLSY
jgi:hypothetical protein